MKKHDLEETPIVFMTIGEHDEALRFGVITKPMNYEDFPMLKWVNADGRESYQTNSSLSKQNIWSKPRYIRLLQKSVLWADIRRNYKPKAWYADIRNFGKPIWVRDDVYEEWMPGVLAEYIRGEECPYVLDNATKWRYAKPITAEEIDYKGEGV